MIPSLYTMIDTPALLIDRRLMNANLDFIQDKARRYGVSLRPHIKTHRMPALAKLQMAKGASGITVAKVSEAEVMANNGLSDIFIANEIVGIEKIRRIRTLKQRIRIRTGIDNTFQIDQLDAVFADLPGGIEVSVEIETGENRSGVITDEQLIHLAQHVKTKKNVFLTGVFSHEGHCYKAATPAECIRLSEESQRRTLAAASILQTLGFPISSVSIGSTPSIFHAGILPGITEVRPGTYIFMDVGQGSAIGDFSRCAATVLGTVISKPTADRIVLDTGAKALTMQSRSVGICASPGLGLVKNSENIRLSGVFDEHGLILNEEFSSKVAIGDKLEIIPNHICPVCNLYDKAYLVEDGRIIEEIPILCRGRSQ